MEALSIKQPYAQLICLGIKDVENRNWDTNVRGKIWIHASKKRDESARLHLDMLGCPYPEIPYNYFGALIGTVDLVAVVKHSDSDWFYGKYGFVFENPFLLNKPIPYIGHLSFFDVELPGGM